ncbi:hypothetical protein P4S64_17910 [Vibrio sp. M60_M31a]
MITTSLEDGMESERAQLYLNLWLSLLRQGSAPEQASALRRYVSTWL